MLRDLQLGTRFPRTHPSDPDVLHWRVSLPEPPSKCHSEPANWLGSIQVIGAEALCHRLGSSL